MSLSARHATCSFITVPHLGRNLSETLLPSLPPSSNNYNWRLACGKVIHWMLSVLPSFVRYPSEERK